MLVVNMDYVPGYEIRQILGEVHGITARSRNAYNEGVKFLTGDSNPRMRAALSRWRDDAIAEMAKVAQARGANAVVSMRFDHRDVTPSWTEICAYGTAVYVVAVAPKPKPEPVAAIAIRGTAREPTHT
jgi:uncharacterized protein YbjQ (UPF0145 family)